MKNLIRFLIGIIIIFLIVITSFLIFSSIKNDVKMPKLETENLDFGKIEYNNENTALYMVSTQKLSSSYSFIDLRINEYVDSLVASVENKDLSEYKDKIKDSEILKQKIDTYKVNDNILSVKVTSMLKKSGEENYATCVKNFNFRTDLKRELELNELFKESIKEKIGEENNFLLTQNKLQIFNSSKATSYTYNSLKEYNSSKLLTAENYEMTQEEYNELMSRVIDKDRKMVAITFDDGPHKTNTNKIIDILKKYNARATFFMLGSNVKLYPDVVKDVYLSNSEIGIHTWDHKDLTTLSSENILSQVQTTSDAIYEITGKRPTLLRPPYGSFNNTVKSTVDMPLILWNIDSLDWQSRDPEKIVPLVLNSVKDGDIILLHDIHATTIPAAERIIDSLTKEDYQIITVSELLEAKGYDTSTTRVFYSGRQ